MKKYNRIYAYTTIEVENKEWEGNRNGIGLIKVGQTSNLTSNKRIKAQLQGSPHLLNNGYKILLDVEAIKENGEYFSDHDVFNVLKAMKVNRISSTEWFECNLEEIKEAINILKNNFTARNVSLKLKDTVNNRGFKKDNKLKEIEKQRILKEQNILNTIRNYSDANSAIKIAEYIMKEQNITQFALLL